MKIKKYIEFIKCADIIESNTVNSKQHDKNTHPEYHLNNNGALVAPVNYFNQLQPQQPKMYSPRVSDSFHVQQAPPNLQTILPPRELANSVLLGRYNKLDGNIISEYSDALSHESNNQLIHSIVDFDGAKNVTQNYDMARQLSYSPYNSPTYNNDLRTTPLYIESGVNYNDTTAPAVPESNYLVVDHVRDLSNPKIPKTDKILTNYIPGIHADPKSGLPTLMHELRHKLSNTPDGFITNSDSIFNPWHHLPDEFLATGSTLDRIQTHPSLIKNPRLQQELLKYMRLGLIPALGTYIYNPGIPSNSDTWPTNLPFSNRITPQGVSDYLQSAEYNTDFTRYTGREPEGIASMSKPPKGLVNSWDGMDPSTRQYAITFNNFRGINNDIATLENSALFPVENIRLISELERLNPAQQDQWRAWYNNPRLHNPETLMQYASPDLQDALKSIAIERGVELPDELKNLQIVTDPNYEYRKQLEDLILKRSGDAKSRIRRIDGLGRDRIDSTALDIIRTYRLNDIRDRLYPERAGRVKAIMEDSIAELAANAGLSVPEFLSKAEASYAINNPRSTTVSGGLYSPVLTEGWKPLPGIPEGYNTSKFKWFMNPYSPTPTELSQLPNLYTTENIPLSEKIVSGIGNKVTNLVESGIPEANTSLKSERLRQLQRAMKTSDTFDTLAKNVGKIEKSLSSLPRSAGNVLTGADAVARGVNDSVTLPETSDAKYGKMSWAEREAVSAYNTARAQGKSHEEAQAAANGMFSTAVALGGVGGGINRMPQIGLDYTVKAPTDIYNLFQAAKEYVGFTPTYLKSLEGKADIDTDKVTLYNLFGGDIGGSWGQLGNAVGQGVANTVQIPFNVAYNTFYQTPKDLITGLDPTWAKDQTKYYRPDLQEKEMQRLETIASKWNPEQQEAAYSNWEQSAQQLGEAIQVLKKRINTNKNDSGRNKQQLDADTKQLAEKQLQWNNLQLSLATLRKLNPSLETSDPAILNPEYFPMLPEVDDYSAAAIANREVNQNAQQALQEVNSNVPTVDRDAINRSIDAMLEEEEDPYSWMPKQR